MTTMIRTFSVSLRNSPLTLFSSNINLRYIYYSARLKNTIQNYKCQNFSKISDFSGRLKDSSQRQDKFVTLLDAVKYQRERPVYVIYVKYNFSSINPDQILC